MNHGDEANDKNYEANDKNDESDELNNDSDETNDEGGENEHSVAASLRGGDVNEKYGTPESSAEAKRPRVDKGGLEVNQRPRSDANDKMAVANERSPGEEKLEQQRIGIEAKLRELQTTLQEIQALQQESIAKPMNIASIHLDGPHSSLEFKNGGCYSFLLDTGSHYSLISLNIVKEMNEFSRVESTNVTLTSVSGDSLDVVGSITLDCTMGHVTREIVFVVVKDNLVDLAILGNEAMAKFGVAIDTNKRTVSCGDYTMTYQLNSRNMGKACAVRYTGAREDCNVKLEKDELIPAKGRKVVVGRLFGNKKITTKSCLLECEYSQSRYGLVIPACVVDTAEVIPFVVHNVLDHPVKLKKEARMGTCVETRIDEIDPEGTIEMQRDVEGANYSPDGHPMNSLRMPTDITNEQRSQLSTVLLKYHEVFSRHESDIGLYKLGQARLDLKKDYKVVTEPPRKYNVAQREELDKQIKIL